MKRIRVARFRDRPEAEPIRQRLVEAGIRAEVHDELGLARLWFTNKRTAGTRLEVPAGQAARAEDLLRDWDAASGALSRAIRCPDCKSWRIDYPQFTPKSFLTNLALGFLAELRLVEREYYCEDCHCMWARENTKPRRVRAHLAPNYFVEGLEPPPSPSTAAAPELGRDPAASPRQIRFADGSFPQGLSLLEPNLAPHSVRSQTT